MITFLVKHEGYFFIIKICITVILQYNCIIQSSISLNLYITPKRVTSLWILSTRHYARATQLLSKKRCSGGEPLATLCLIQLTRDSNFRPPTPET